MESQGAQARRCDVARSRALAEAWPGVRRRGRWQVSAVRDEVGGDPLQIHCRAMCRDEGEWQVLDVLQRSERAHRDLRRSHLVDADGGREWTPARGAVT